MDSGPDPPADTVPNLPRGFRGQPRNLEAEQALLGAIFVNNDAYHQVAAFLRPEHFWEPVHARVYNVIGRLIGQGRLADPITLKAAFDDDEALQELNGWEYLARLARAAETILHAEDYGREIHALALKRGLIRVAEDAANAGYDSSSERSPAHLLRDLRADVEQLSQATAAPCAMPALDWAMVAEEEPPADRWLIADWVPVGTAGLLAGPGMAGKSYLSLIQAVSLAAGLPWLGYDVEPCPVLAYYSEDSQDRLWHRLRTICAALQVDPYRLQGRLEVVSTVGHRRLLVRADPGAHLVEATDWYAQVQDRARALGARYVILDHIGRLCALNRNSAEQVIDLVAHLEALATSIDGAVCVLAHPSKTDRRGGRVNGMPSVGGAGALIDGPRWVHSLETVAEDDGSIWRVLRRDKSNYSRRMALKLVDGPHGVVVPDGEVDPDDPSGGKVKGPRHRPSQADRTVEVLSELYRTHHRAIHLDEIVRECMRQGVIIEADDKSDAWRNRRKTILSHLSRFRSSIDDRGDATYALKP